jgi:hypothetical protein
MARVIIPGNPDEFIKLMDDIITQEEKLAPDGIFTATELTEFKGYRSTANAANEDQKKLYREAEEKTRERDNALGTAPGLRVDIPGSGMYLTTYLRDILLAKNKTNPKALGQWGFTVDDSTAPKPPAPPAV